MIILGLVVSTPLISIIAYFVYRYQLGHQISKSLMMFSHSYDSMLVGGIPKEQSFAKSIRAFKDIRPFRKISENEWENIANIFAGLDDPKDSFIRLMMIPSRKIIWFLKNPDHEVINELIAVDNEGDDLFRGVAKLTEIVDRKYSEKPFSND